MSYSHFSIVGDLVSISLICFFQAIVHPAAEEALAPALAAAPAIIAPALDAAPVIIAPALAPAPAVVAAAAAAGGQAAAARQREFHFNLILDSNLDTP